MQRGYDYLGKLESVELPVGAWVLVILLFGLGLGWLLGQIGWWVFADAVPALLKLVSAAVTFPLRWYRRRGAAGEAPRRAGEAAAAGDTPEERQAPDPLFY